MKHTITIGHNNWLGSFGIGLLCIPLGIFIALACLLIIIVGPVMGALGLLVIKDDE